MKHFFYALSIIVLLFVTNASKAQTENDWFITEWNTSLSSNTGRILFKGAGTNYNLKFENVANPGVFTTVTTGTNATTQVAITVPTPGATYRVYAYRKPSVAGSVFNGYQSSSGAIPPGAATAEADGLVKIVQWGTTVWRANMSLAFVNSRNMDLVAADVPNLSQVTDMNNFFAVCTSMVANTSINNWDVSKVGRMNGMFQSCYAFNQPLNGWNTQSAFDMNSMFSSARSFNQPLDKWKTGGVVNTSSMFSNALAFNQDISNWDVTKVINTQSMFNGARAFDQNLGAWTLNQLGAGGPWNANGIYMFANSGMSCVNYTKTLEGWANNPLTASSVSFTGQSGRQYGSTAGRDFLIAKGWTISSDTYNEGCGGALPVKFENIQARIAANVLSVTWSTAYEKNNSHFIIEASKDGKNFEKIGEVKSTANDGNSDKNINYDFSADLNTSAASLLGVSIAALLIGIFGFRLRNQWLYAILLTAGFGLMSISACTKKDNTSEFQKDQKLFIRITQVDKNGSSESSKVIQAIRE